MLKILYNRKQTAEKKNLINRISELTGIKPKYLGAPNMVYQIGSYQVDREGNLIAPDDQDAMELAEALKLYGFEEIRPVSDEEARESATEETLSIAFPLNLHTGLSIRNLVNLIYSRGALVSKAVHGDFSAPQELVDALSTKNAANAEDAINHIKEFEAENGVEIKGIRFEEDRVVFSGFPKTSDADILLAFQHLTEKMNKQAIEQIRIQAKLADDENEKYSMRTWLVRIGLGGSKYKKTRNILMENLKGHTAFRTPEDAERWKTKQDALKAKRKAVQETEECMK